jgi:hypothetical protein
MMPLVLRAAIVPGRDDLQALQDKAILIDEICDDRQYRSGIGRIRIIARNVFILLSVSAMVFMA